MERCIYFRKSMSSEILNISWQEPTDVLEMKYAFIDMSLFPSLTSQFYSKGKEWL